VQADAGGGGGGGGGGPSSTGSSAGSSLKKDFSRKSTVMSLPPPQRRSRLRAAEEGRSGAVALLQRASEAHATRVAWRRDRSPAPAQSLESRAALHPLQQQPQRRGPVTGRTVLVKMLKPPCKERGFSGATRGTSGIRGNWQPHVGWAGELHSRVVELIAVVPWGDLLRLRLWPTCNPHGSNLPALPPLACRILPRSTHSAGRSA